MNGTASATVTATPVAANRAPTVANSLPDRQAPTGQAFSYQFPADAFADADSDTLSYTATQGDGSALPTWLTFTQASRTFAGTPQSGNAGTVTVRVTADDSNGGTVTDSFDIEVAAAAANVSLTISFDPFEDNEDAEVEVELSAAVSGAAVEVYLTATDGTATKGADYAAGTETGPGGAAGLYKVTIAAGMTSATLSIALTDDAILEGDETFTVAIADIVSTEVIGRGATTTVTVTIADSESGATASPTSLNLRETAGSVLQSEGTYTLVLTTPPTADVTVAVDALDPRA